MRIKINTDQFERLQESISFKDLKNRYNYTFNLNKEKHPGVDNYDRYVLVKTFQKYVDAVYKYVKNEVEFDGIDGINVATVWVNYSGGNFNKPEIPGNRVDYLVRLFPNIDKNNPPKSQEDFELQYSLFKKVFRKYFDDLSLNTIQPIKKEQIKNGKVTFDFLSWKLKDGSPLIKIEL